mmetsp:Transcript_19443/g.23951  ORF Transcript_19443/g.23951 Transcript_19443/m.23951 type:complete len:118 (+) Transcript_19443:33-386(+)
MAVQCAHLPYYTIGRPANWRKIDLWALAVILHYMLFHRLPAWCYDDNENSLQEVPEYLNNMFFNLICVNRQLRTIVRHTDIWNVSDDALDLLQNMLLANPEERLSTQEILNHRWLQE